MLFDATPQSLSAHQTPRWWSDAKLGVMMHWSLSSVPAWAPREHDILSLLRDRPQDALAHTPYAEWYENSIKFPDGPSARWHRDHWGGRPYEVFRDLFETHLSAWSPDPFLDLVTESGARYLVPVTKHHDGYCLWPTETPNPLRGESWRAPRDVIGELAAGARARGLAFGVYYSGGLDWTLDPRPVASLADMRVTMLRGPAATQLVRAHYDELIARYDPDLLWNDIGYPDAEDLWRLLADFYNGRADRLVNDRFQLPDPNAGALLGAEERAALNARIAAALAQPGFAFAPERPPVFDHRTPEYAVGAADPGEPWETVRGVGRSFGFNQTETAADHLTSDGLISLFIRIVGGGGNLLINIGPRADGSIPELQAAPLRGLGGWLEDHGKAIFGTRPSTRFSRAPFGGTEALPVENGSNQYVLLPERPRPGEHALEIGAGVLAVETLAGERLAARSEAGTLVFALPDTSDAATALKLLC